jgi:glycosyltransferase involved in cell wall biosynthesis
LIEAFSEILKNHKAHLTMIGSTVFADQKQHDLILKKINDLQLNPHITLKYDINPIEMSTAYQEHDVFVLPSVDEPFSISPLEAMAEGLPAIVTDSNGCQFHVQDGVNGYVVKSNDREALASALYKIINRKNLNQLKVGALEYTKNINNEENFLKQFKLLTSRIKVN